MDNVFFFNPNTKDGKKAEELLNKNNIKFVNIYQENEENPVILVEGKVWRGLDAIKDFITACGEKCEPG